MRDRIQAGRLNSGLPSLHLWKVFNRTHGVGSELMIYKSYIWVIHKYAHLPPLSTTPLALLFLLQLMHRWDTISFCSVTLKEKKKGIPGKKRDKRPRRRHATRIPHMPVMPRFQKPRPHIDHLLDMILETRSTWMRQPDGQPIHKNNVYGNSREALAAWLMKFLVSLVGNNTTRPQWENEGGLSPPRLPPPFLTLHCNHGKHPVSVAFGWGPAIKGCYRALEKTQVC